jgi:peptidase E
MSIPRIVAMGGGGFLMEPRNPRLDSWILSLARRRRRRRVLFIPTASGDSEWAITRFHRSMAKLDCETAHLPLFNRRHVDLRDAVLPHDVIYVGGGNTANMLAVWRLHGVDALLREAWQSGTVLCGVSAGAICWFDGGLTDSYGPELRPLRGGLAFLPGSFCPHYDGEAARRPGFTRAIASGALPPGYAADDGVGVLFEGTTFVEAAASRRKVSAYRVERSGETALPTRHL